MLAPIPSACESTAAELLKAILQVTEEVLHVAHSTSLAALLFHLCHTAEGAHIRMTLHYLQVTQPDLPRELYKARQNTMQSYRLPVLSVSAVTADLPGIRQALAATPPFRGVPAPAL